MTAPAHPESAPNMGRRREARATGAALVPRQAERRLRPGLREPMFATRSRRASVALIVFDRGRLRRLASAVRHNLAAPPLRARFLSLASRR